MLDTTELFFMKKNILIDDVLLKGIVSLTYVDNILLY